MSDRKVDGQIEESFESPPNKFKDSESECTENSEAVPEESNNKQKAGLTKGSLILKASVSKQQSSVKLGEMTPPPYNIEESWPPTLKQVLRS